MKSTATIRSYPAGTPATGAAYTITRHVDGIPIDTGHFTDGNGQFTYQTNLSPGPIFWDASVAGINPGDPPITRRGSSKSTGSGGAYSLAELPYALRALRSGVIAGYANQMAPSYSSGLQFSVATGAAVALGIPAVIYTAVTNQAVVNARDATNPRQCYVVLEWQGPGTTEEGKVVLKDLCGAAAASPVLPTLLQNDTVWQEPLATFRLPNTGSSTLTQFTPIARVLGGPDPAQVASVARRTDPAVTPVTVTSTSGIDVGWTSGISTITGNFGITYDLTMEFQLLVKAPPGGAIISVAGYLNGSANVGPYVSMNLSDNYHLISNVHSLSGVVGTGFFMSCGALIKVSAGTGSYHTGSQIVTATPR